MIFIHIFTVWAAIYWRPIHPVSTYSLVLSVLLRRITGYGYALPIGYHRFYSHRAFRATFAVRVIIAVLGMATSQGSIRTGDYRCLRHRSHHVLYLFLLFLNIHVKPGRYAATRGSIRTSGMDPELCRRQYCLFTILEGGSSITVLERIGLVDRKDLDSDPQDYRLPGSIFLGFIKPALLGTLWGDPSGSFVWGGLLLTVITAGEGSHNFHTFLHDWRTDPHPWRWDPSKWVIFVFYWLGLVSHLRTVNEADMKEAMRPLGGEPAEEDAIEYVASRAGCCVMIIEDDVAPHLGYHVGPHPGGAKILRKYAVAARQDLVPSASWAFNGGLNNHSRSARRRMRMLRVARLRGECEE
ncbi:delta 9-fatty acid desaturase protein [Mycena leptocephala]|nr:delta 9-fatty acid desaturase protein [Mycena leptocephala]